jgi:hypothetical protein
MTLLKQDPSAHRPFLRHVVSFLFQLGEPNLAKFIVSWAGSKRIMGSIIGDLSG